MFNAEVSASVLAALPERADGLDEDTRRLVIAAMTREASQQYGPVGAAYLRLLMSLGSPVLKREASRQLAEFTEDGVYPPEWVSSIGKPTPVRAWRTYDVYGDREVIVVTYAYGDAEHALLLSLDRTELPTVDLISVGADGEAMLTMLREQARPYERSEELTLAEARRRIEGPLLRAGNDDAIPFDGSSELLLPLARSRVRRLPSAQDGATPAYMTADRAAAVAEFLGSSQAANAGSPDVARFWAQVLTGYSSRLPGEAPGEVGPLKLYALLLHAASTFTLTDAQFEGLRPALTAWVRWTVERRGLDEAAAEHLMSRLPKILDEFPVTYDDPYSVEARRYVRDLAASDVDVAWLAEQRERRELAAPFPGDRDPDDAGIDATDPDGRADLTASEFALCAPGGDAGAEFLAAATRVVEELWHDAPAGTWQAAKPLTAQGMDRHDIIHSLTKSR